MEGEERTGANEAVEARGKVQQTWRPGDLEELNICYVSLSHVSTLKFCRFSPHTLHLEKKIEVFPAEGSPDLKISPIPHGRRNLPVEEWLQVECERR